MKKFLSTLLSLFLGSSAFASDGQMLYDTGLYQRQTSGGGSSGAFALPEPTFWAPFDDPSSPLTLYRGTGSLSFTRATTATYVHSTTGLVTSAADNVLRIEANGALIEGQRTNLLTYSEQFDHADWVGTEYITVVADNVVSPDGTLSADMFVEDTTTNYHRTHQMATASPGENVFSVFVKAGTRRYVQLMTMNQLGEGQNRLCFDFQTLATLSVDNTRTGFVSVGNGWYRLWVGSDFSVSTTSVFGLIHMSNTLTVAETPPTYLGDGSTVYAWGAQLEASSFPSSYIPTTASTVTKNKDDLTLPTTSNISNVAGTIVINWTPEFSSTAGVGSPVLFDCGLKAYYNATDDKLYFTDGTNSIASAALTFAAGDTIKLGFAWGTGLLRIAKDGAIAATGATYTAPALNANLYIGSDVSAANHAFSNLRNKRGWNRAFNDEEMKGVASK